MTVFLREGMRRPSHTKQIFGNDDGPGLTFAASLVELVQC